MQIEKDCVVSFHYQLTDDAGKALESSRDDGVPAAYLHGHRNIIRGLEESMEGRKAGDTYTVTVEPSQGYGLRREGSQQRVPIKHLLNKGKIKPGQIVSIQTEKGVRQGLAVKVGKFNVDVDTNHPLAGKTLVFEVEVIEVRKASAEEISHGHAHGVGGHQH
jgi:FKBP-type peptidyl-prolyl cis-trans isomerase SlyD